MITRNMVTNNMDMTARDQFGNTVSKITIGVNEAMQELNEVATLRDYLKEIGSLDNVAALDLFIARRALQLERHLDAYHQLIVETKKLAGDKALKAAAQPVRIVD